MRLLTSCWKAEVFGKAQQVTEAVAFRWKKELALTPSEFSFLMHVVGTHGSSWAKFGLGKGGVDFAEGIQPLSEPDDANQPKTEIYVVQP